MQNQLNQQREVREWRGVVLNCPHGGEFTLPYVLTGTADAGASLSAYAVDSNGNRVGFTWPVPVPLGTSNANFAFQFGGLTVCNYYLLVIAWTNPDGTHGTSSCSVHCG